MTFMLSFEWAPVLIDKAQHGGHKQYMNVFMPPDPFWACESARFVYVCLLCSKQNAV